MLEGEEDVGEKMKSGFPNADADAWQSLLVSKYHLVWQVRPFSSAFHIRIEVLASRPDLQHVFIVGAPSRLLVIIHLVRTDSFTRSIEHRESTRELIKGSN